jgi:hypothetical protein
MKSVLESYLEYLNETVLTPNRLLKWLKTFRGTPAELQKVIDNKIRMLDAKKATIEKMGKLRKIDNDKAFDRLDITTDKWELMSITPQIETLTTGSQYAYDGGDRFYFEKDATQRCYYVDMITNTVNGAGQYPYAAGTAVIGNRMEIFKTPDGLKYLLINRPSQAEMFRQLLFY